MTQKSSREFIFFYRHGKRELAQFDARYQELAVMEPSLMEDIDVAAKNEAFRRAKLMMLVLNQIIGKVFLNIKHNFLQI